MKIKLWKLIELNARIDIIAMENPENYHNLEEFRELVDFRTTLIKEEKK